MKQLFLLFAFVGLFTFGANAQKAPVKAELSTAKTTAKSVKDVDAKTISKLAAKDSNIEERVCAKSGKVSYFQKSTCAKSGKVSYDEVKYCNKSKGFVKTVANTAESGKVCTKGQKKSCAKKCSKAEKAACAKNKKACSKGKKACSKGKKAAKTEIKK